MIGPQVFTAWDGSFISTVAEASHVGGFECVSHETRGGSVVECKYFKTRREAVRYARGLTEDAGGVFA